MAVMSIPAAVAAVAAMAAIATVVVTPAAIIPWCVIGPPIDHGWRHYDRRSRADGSRVTNNRRGRTHHRRSGCINARVRFEYRQWNRQRQREANGNMHSGTRRLACRQPHPDYC
jgi:hypothetical protein